MGALLGRSAELADLGRALASARSGRGRLVLVGGAAGIGKTALAERAAETARGLGMAVARGRAVDDPGAPPLWPWVRALGGTVELTAPQVDGHDPSTRFRLFADVVARLRGRASAGGLLLVLEDLHWADPVSLALVRHLAAELSDEPIAFVVTYRDTADGPFGELLPELLRGEQVSSMVLTGLGRDDVSSWFAATGLGRDDAVAGEVHRVTGGNPLLVRLVLAHLDAGGELGAAVTERSDLRRLVMSRVAVLPEADRVVVEDAALLAERVHPAAVAAMRERSTAEVDDALHRAVAAGVLRRTSDGGLSFEHALVRDVVLAGLTELPARHRSAALALMAVAAPAAPIAMHWQRAGDPEQLRHWAERASVEASAALAHDDAARFAELAVSAAGAVADAERARLLVLAAGALTRASRFEDAVAACVRAAECAERAGRPELLVAAALAVHGVGVGAFTSLAPVAERALVAVGSDDHAGRARLLAQLSVGATELDDVTRGRELALEAIAAADASGDQVAVVESLAARHLSIVGPDTVRERLALGRRAVELGGDGTSPIAALWGHLWRGAAAFQLGNLVQGEHEVAEIDRIARTLRSPLARWHHHRFRAMAAGLTGDFDRAREENLAAFRLGERVDDISLTGMSYSFGLALAMVRGDAGELLAGWEQAMRFAPPLPVVRVGIPLGRALLGDRDGARAEFVGFRHLPATMPRGVRWAGTMALIGHTAILLEDAEVCSAVHDVVVPVADQYAGDGSGAVFSHGANAGFVADLGRVAGRHDEALPHFRAAVAMNERIGARPWTARARLGWARSLLALGLRHDPVGRETPADLVGAAAGEFRRLDMPGPLATALALDLGGAVLSPRETEVANLVAESLSNREIAARLHLSERTVESHVRNILVKLDATRRTEIVARFVSRR